MKASIKANLEIVKLTTKEILLSFVDSVAWFYEKKHVFRRAASEYLDDRSIERSSFLSKIRFLKRQGYIQDFVEGKEKYFELTNKGLDRAKESYIDSLSISRPSQWDGKWRVVIFDVKEEKHYQRDLFRKKIFELGFEQIQYSVYAYPFECAKEISFIAEILGIEKSVVIMIADIIQGEEYVIDKLIDRKILLKIDLEKTKTSKYLRP